MNNDLSEIKNRLNIVDVIGEYLRLEKAGNNHRALCPFHNEKSPSFMISEEKQMWHCFGCQKGGDVFSFVMEIEGLEFREALKILADKAGVKLSSYNPEKQEKESRALEILELATRFYETQLWKGVGKIKIIDYLKGRGFSEQSIKDFRLGYAPSGWRNLLDFLLGRGYGLAEIEKTGLLVKKDNGDAYDRFRDRIIFPIADTNGRVVGYSARVAPGGDESQAKYVNTPETDAYHKSKILYGIDRAKVEIKKQDFVLLVEGNADVVASHQAGIRNTVAVSGTALTEEQVGIIKRYTKSIYLFFDMDQAGQAAAKKSVKLCFANEMNVKIVSISEGKDAADIVRDDPNLFLEAIKNALPAMDYFLKKNILENEKDEIEGRKKIINEMLDLIASITDEVEKDFWIKKIAEALDIREGILTERLKKSILEGRRGQMTSGSFVSEKQESFEEKSRIDILIEKLISLMLVFPEIWKKVSEEGNFVALGGQKKILGTLLGKGQEAGFRFENLMNSEISSEEKKIFEGLFFSGKFHFGIDSKIEEVEEIDPEGERKKIEREIEIEIRKKALNRITKNMRVAKEKGDKEAENNLRLESQKVSKELAELIN